MQDERLEILKALTRHMSLSEDTDLSQLAEMCEHFTGADFKALLYNAQLEAVHGGLARGEESTDYQAGGECLSQPGDTGVGFTYGYHKLGDADTGHKYGCHNLWDTGAGDKC